MPSFQDWLEWTHQQNNEWRAVGDNADREAPYENGNGRQTFQSAVAAEDPRTPDTYNRLCRAHLFQGREVEAEHRPEWLTRVVPYKSIEDKDRELYGGNAPVAASRPPRRWQGFAANTEDGYLIAGLRPAKAPETGAPEQVAVFAGLDKQDRCESMRPRCAILERARQEKASRSTAEQLVYVLALPRPGSPRAVIFYRSQPGHDCRFPVPADAGHFHLWRGLPAATTHYCGRTRPADRTDADHANLHCGENETVHDNRLIALKDMWVYRFDKNGE